MPTLLLRLAGPMQSWGTQSRFEHRDSHLEPSKSGVIGLICAAMGVDRRETAPVLALAGCTMGVRVDREGVLRVDYLTAQGDDRLYLSPKSYLADAKFLVGLESEDSALLQKAHRALQNPTWPLALGRKSYVPSPGVYLKDGLLECPLEQALLEYPLLDEAQDPQQPLRFVFESQDGSGSLRFDQPSSSFAEHRFVARYVYNVYQEVGRVSQPSTA